MMPGENAPPMHPNCRCSVAAYEEDAEYEAWLDYMENGGTMEEWNASGLKAWKKAQKGLGKGKTKAYNGGIPRAWDKLEVSEDDAVKNTNPSYKADKIDEYSTNCFNCVNAFEMRRRGYDVIAQPATDNYYLSRYPWEAWENAKIIKTRGSGLSDITKALKELEGDARVEIAAFWKADGSGHVFVGEKIGNRIAFHDPQKGMTNVEWYFDEIIEDQTTFWRIDNLNPSDRGISACRKVEK